MQTLLAAYDTISDAGTAVSEIIAAGIIPAAVEMMDALAIQAAEAAVHPNFPPADTILIVELDGPAAEVRELFAIVEEICRRTGATDDRSGGRRSAARAHLEGPQGGVCGDGPRLAELLRAGRRGAAHEAARSARRASARCPSARACASATCFTPATATCTRSSATTSRCRARRSWPRTVAGEILTYCVEAGGSITGEHGVGADKKHYMPRMFSDDDLDAMQQVRDALRPAAPLQSRQGAAHAAPVRRGARTVSRSIPLERAGLAERF